MLEMQAGLLQLLTMPQNPIERGWYGVHRPSKQRSEVAAAFQRFLRLRGQYKINRTLVEREATFDPMADAARHRAGCTG